MYEDTVIIYSAPKTLPLQTFSCVLKIRMGGGGERVAHQNASTISLTLPHAWINSDTQWQTEESKAFTRLCVCVCVCVHYYVLGLFVVTFCSFVFFGGERRGDTKKKRLQYPPPSHPPKKPVCVCGGGNHTKQFHKQYACTHTHTHTHIYVCMHVHIHLHIQTHILTPTWVLLHTHLNNNNKSVSVKHVNSLPLPIYLPILFMKSSHKYQRQSYWCKSCGCQCKTESH